ncbi:hypothetical protein EDB89DRAFT_125763 [Lactarius sanguifluus]|nr:hypothetical protein EDB89DRAFT_125763 [Lactarius sanguifluus]
MSLSSLGPILLPVSLDATATTSWTQDSRPSSPPLDITPISASSVPQLGCQSPLIYVAPSILDPRPLSLTLPSTRLLSGFSPTRLTFALSIAALVSVLLNVSKTLSIHERKLSKIKELSNSRNKTCDDFARRLRLGQYTPRASVLIRKGWLWYSIRHTKDSATQRKSKTRYGFITTCNVTSPTSILPTISSFSTLKLRVYLEEA